MRRPRLARCFLAFYILCVPFFAMGAFRNAFEDADGSSAFTGDLAGGNLTNAADGTFSGTVTGGTLTDGTASLSSGSLTSGVDGTFSGTVQAEQLTSTDDAIITDDLSVGGDAAVTGTLSGGSVSDGTATLSSGSLTGGVNGTFSGTVQAEQLTSTDDAIITDDLSVGGNVLTSGCIEIPAHNGLTSAPIPATASSLFVYAQRNSGSAPVLYLDTGEDTSINLAFGYESLSQAAAWGLGNGNICFGKYAGRYLRQTSADNIAIGDETMDSVLAGNYRGVAIGKGALSGGGSTDCVAIGYNALAALNDGYSRNIAIGREAAKGAFNVNDIVVIGADSAIANNFAADDCVIIGSDSCNTTLDADHIIAIGGQVMQNNQNCDHCVAIGRFAGDELTTGSANRIYLGGYDVGTTTQYPLDHRWEVTSVDSNNHIENFYVNRTQYRLPLVDHATGVLTVDKLKVNDAVYDLTAADAAITTTTTLDATYHFIKLDADSNDIKITLPAAASNSGLTYRFKVTTDPGSYTITLDGNASETIDGATTNTTLLSEQYDSATLVCDGTEWWIY